MPAWVKLTIEAQTSGAGINNGHAFRPVNRAGSVTGEGLGEKWSGRCCGNMPPTLESPESCCTTAVARVQKLCRAAGRGLEQIRMILGHAWVQTTELYLGTKQDLPHRRTTRSSSRVPACVVVPRVERGSVGPYRDEKSPPALTTLNFCWSSNTELVDSLAME
jgi:hypothetical protein